MPRFREIEPAVAARAGTRAMVLASHPSILSFGIAEIRREHLLPRDQQKCQQNGRWRELLRVFSMHRENFPENLEPNQLYKLLLLLLMFSAWCPWPAVTYFLNYPNLWRF